MPRPVRAALLFGFAALVAKLFLTGEMAKYMNPALDPLTALAGFGVAVMGVAELRGSRDEGNPGPGLDRHEHGADRTEQLLTGLLLLMPIVLGFLLVPRALGAGALGGENVADHLLRFGGAAAPARGGDAPAPVIPIEDVPGLLAYLRQAGESGVGQRVRATGLVARGEAFRPGELALLRFAIAHCVADARPLALLVVSDGPELAGDQWVLVEGTLDSRERDGDRLVSIVADSITPVAEPDNPYLTSGQ